MAASTEPPDRSRGWWDRLDVLFDEACALPEADRAAFLDRACPDDPELRAEILSLLSHAGAITFPGPDGPQAGGGGWASARTPSPDPLVGRSLGRYEIQALVGMGGMGRVYRARDTQLNRPVALKFLAPRLGTDPAVKERFRVEARAAAALDHPNICTIYEVGENPEGCLFIAMAHYEGRTLKDRLSEGPLPVQEAVDAIVQTAHGLEAAHSAGIVHRDIKPGNVIVTPEGVAKLLDFGIAKAGTPSPDRAGITRGTIAYMSPEQLRGEPVDRRSDIWSLGVVLYELLAGRRPFEGRTPSRLLDAVLRDGPPPLSHVRSDLPSGVDAVVRRALSWDVHQRPQSAGAFIHALTAATDGVSRRGGEWDQDSLRPGLQRWRRTRAASGILTASFAVLLATGSLLSEGLGSGASAPPPIAPSAAPPAGSASTGSVPGSTLPAVGVLAFQDLTSEADRAWLGEGLAEAVLDELREVDGLRLTGTLSWFGFEGGEEDLSSVGAALGVRYLLAGTSRTLGDSVRVTARLWDAEAGIELWSETYGRAATAEELLLVPGTIAGDVGSALDLVLPPGGGPTAGGPDDEAYESYLEGRYHLRRAQAGLAGGSQALARSVELFRAVVSRSPRWAPGWAALGEGLHWAATHAGGLGFEPQIHFPESKAALTRALQLDPQLALAHASLGYVAHRWDLDYAAADRHFRRALELDPDQYFHCGYALFLLWAGRHDDAILAFRRAEAADPLFILLKEFLAGSYRCAGRLDEAVASAEEVLAADPGSWAGLRDIVLGLQESGRTTEALARLDRTPREHPYVDPLRALVHARAGEAEEAERVLDVLDEEALLASAHERFASRRVSPVPLLAATLVALGRPEAAIQALERMMELDPGGLLYDRCYPELATLEGDPRYQDLLRRVGVPPSPTADRAPTAE